MELQEQESYHKPPPILEQMIWNHCVAHTVKNNNNLSLSRISAKSRNIQSHKMKVIIIRPQLHHDYTLAQITEKTSISAAEGKVEIS